MVITLKNGIAKAHTLQANQQVRESVERILEDVARRGDEAVYEVSRRFDGWSPDSLRLDSRQIDVLISSLPDQVISDLRFAQE